MVQQDMATSDAEAQAASPEDSSDHPPALEEFVERFPFEDEPGAQQSSEQQGAGEESTGDAEQPGEGAADADIEVLSTEEAEQPEAEAEGEGGTRQRTEEDFRNLQSAYDRQVAELTRHVQQLEQRTSQEAFQAQVQAVENQWARGLVESQGLAEQDAQAIARQYSQMAARAYQNEQFAQQIAAAMQQTHGQTEYTARSVVARDLAAKYGIPDEDRPLLLGYNDPQTMEQAARRLGQYNKRTREVAEKRQNEVPSDGDAQNFETGTAQAAMTDAQIWHAFGSGQIDDTARAMEAGRRLGYI